MNKKILISLSVIAAVAALAISGTIAYFSDTETSTGNTFTAGSLDLKVDNTCHYDGMVCTLAAGAPSAVWQEESLNSSTYPELLGTACTCTWLEKDLTTGDVFFNFTDVKPGDTGENTISLHPVSNDANVCAYVSSLTNNDNGLTEPESHVDTTGGVGEGELQNAIHMKIWRDKGVNENGQVVGRCDNEFQQGEMVYVEDAVIDSNVGPWDLGQITGDRTVCLGVAWSIPTTVGNEIQGDSITGNISFYAEQVRNNANFTCPATLPVERAAS